MRCVTWTRDSHGLFDYESKNIQKKNIKTHTGGKVILVGDEVQLVSRNHIFGHSSRPMLSLQRSPVQHGNYVIKNDTKSPIINDPDPEYNQQMLIVVRNTKSNHHNTDYDLNKGDVIKLGRVKFKVKALNSP